LTIWPTASQRLKRLAHRRADMTVLVWFVGLVLLAIGWPLLLGLLGAMRFLVVPVVLIIAFGLLFGWH